MPTATLFDAGDVDVHRKKKKQQQQQQQQANPRRSLRRYLTADSALQLTDNGRIARREHQHQLHHQSPYHPQAIQLWTTSLMAEFNHIIEGELQQLANDQCGHPSQTAKFGSAKRGASSLGATSLMETAAAVELSPWARLQLALIDPSLAVSVNGVTSPAGPSPGHTKPPACLGASSIQQLSADIDLVERQIFDDLDDMTLTLNSSQSPEVLASCSSCSGEGENDHDHQDGATTGRQAAPAADASDPAVHISSPLLRPQELQDFLRRVEDSIRTSNTTLDGGRFHHTDGDDATTTSPAFPLPPPPPPPLASLPATGVCQLDNDVNAALFQCHHRHQQLEAIEANRSETPSPPPTFDNAGTQTSPMSLSRSSSFLWVSDCNCSGSLEDNASVTGSNSHPLTSSSAPACGQAHSEAGSSSISRVVHMDTSLSSLVSESSAAGCALAVHGRSACGRRNRILGTPDSGGANDAEEEEEDDDDDDERSSASLSHSIDGGVGVGGGGGAESGIGTGSPPPRDRRRRPVAVGDRPEVSVQTMPMNRAESDESSDLAVGDDEVSPLDSSASSLTDESSSSSSLSDEDGESAEALAAATAAAAKKREKVRRRETWEKIRRRHSCKRVHSRTGRNGNAKDKDKAEVVWIRRGQSETPPPAAVPAHGAAVPIGSAPVLTTLTDANVTSLLEPPKVLHKPPVVVVQSVTPRPRPRPLLFKFPGSEASPTTTTTGCASSAESTPTAVKLALQSVLAMQLSPASECGVGGTKSSSSAAAFLVPSAVGAVTKKRHLKPISASSTPTEPYITMETGLTAARSHSESAFAELEATEACRWLRATGFPQYAQMYEDWQFPLDLNVVECDHPFLDVDSLQALFRRLAVLNRMAKLRNEKARIRPQGGDESEDEDQECALSDQWTFQRHSRRWSRIVDLPDDPTGLQALIAAGSAAANASTLSSGGGGQPTTIDEDDPDGGMTPANSGVTLVDDSCNTSGDRALHCDPVILGSFRRSSSERLKHGAKSLLRRMESLRSRSRRRPALVRPADGNLVISGPQLVDASGMEDRMKDLNCVDLTPPDSSGSPTSSTPSPDLNRAVAKNQQFNSQEDTFSSCIVSQTASAASTPTVEVAATPSPAGSMKIKRGFFQRRSFRPSASLSKSSGSAAQSAAAADSEHKDAAHSDSECSPSYWRRSPSSSKDANSNETTTTPTPTTAWNSLEQSLRWKSKKSRDPIPADMWRASTVPPSLSDAMPTQMSQQRGKLYLNFTKPSVPGGKSAAACLMPSPDEEPVDLVSTPIVMRSPPAETPTPCGSLRDAERMVESFGFHNDSASTGTATSGSHIDSDYSPAAPGRNPVVVRWHSFRRSSSSTSSVTLNSQPIAIGSLPVGQFALLRKLALLRLTALLERHTSSSKPSWGWDLPKFMRKTKSPDYKDKSMFGVPLSVTVQRTAEALPKPVLSALHYLRQSALDQVGLFRKSGVRSRIAKLKELCEAWAWQCSGPSGCSGQDQPVDFSEHQPYDVADMVKQYFRELPEALMTNKLSETFVTIFQVVPVTQRLDALRCALLLLPDEHREALQTFLAFLTDVAALASINQMTPSNLAVCLAPSLFHLPATSASSSSSSSSTSSSSSSSSTSHNRSAVGSGTSSAAATTTTNGGMGGALAGAVPSGNGNHVNSSSASSPRRRKTVGVPDQRELSQNKAAHECLLQMINDFRHLFTVPDDIFRQCRCNYLEDSVPVTLDDLRTVEFGDWQAYMNGCMAALLKEAKEKSRGWESSSNDVRVDVAWKKVGDGHALRLWRVSTEIEAPPGELLNRVLRERHLWDTSMVKWRCVVRLDKKSDVFHYTTSSEVPPVSRDVTLLRSWRTDLPRGACLVAEMSIDHSDTPITPGTVRSIVLASRYLIQPCGAGKCRLVHLSRVDIMGRSPDWYNKHYGHVTALHMARIRDSFSQHLVADGPESKV